jgi:hypothetical protein
MRIEEDEIINEIVTGEPTAAKYAAIELLESTDEIIKEATELVLVQFEKELRSKKLKGESLKEFASEFKKHCSPQQLELWKDRLNQIYLSVA